MRMLQNITDQLFVPAFGFAKMLVTDKSQFVQPHPKIVKIICKLNKANWPKHNL